MANRWGSNGNSDRLYFGGENKMVKEQVDVESIFLHGYVRNTPSDKEVHAEHQLRVDRST